MANSSLSSSCKWAALSGTNSNGLSFFPIQNQGRSNRIRLATAFFMPAGLGIECDKDYTKCHPTVANIASNSNKVRLLIQARISNTVRQRLFR